MRSAEAGVEPGVELGAEQEADAVAAGRVTRGRGIMTYRFGRISKAFLRKTGMTRIIDPDWDRSAGTGPTLVDPDLNIDPEVVEATRRYAALPGVPETYGSLGYASMGIGSMDRAIQARRRGR